MHLIDIRCKALILRITLAQAFQHKHGFMDFTSIINTASRETIFYSNDVFGHNSNVL